MLIPRFSIRFLLGITTLLAGASLVASYAFRGEAWAIALFSVLVAATALGLASAIGWIVPAGAAPVAALLGVPAGRRARTLVSLGYPTEEGARPKAAPGTARRPLAELMRFERFS